VALRVPGDPYPFLQATGLDREGNKVSFEATGWKARLLQHEFDHLEGRLFTDIMIPQTFVDEVERWEHRLLPEDFEYDGEVDSRNKKE
jgi:peptide deformylase